MVILTNTASQSLQRAGGAMPALKLSPPPSPQTTPLAFVENQRKGTPQGYRKAALDHGIAFRPDGLFTEDDPVLLSLVEAADVLPFEKHLPGGTSPYESLPEGGWITGNEACIRGIDLRLFYSPPAAGDSEGSGRVVGAVRFGEGAAIGVGFHLSAHGGAIETVLDEATAELGKMDFAPFLSTVEANFKIKKVVPLHKSLFVRCDIVKRTGIRVWVHGELYEQDKLTGEEVVLAACDATLCNMVPFLK